MKTLNRTLVIVVITLTGAVAISAQMCGAWEVFVTVVDREHRGVLDATAKFIDVPEDDAARDRTFNPLMPDSNIYVARFSEGENVARENGQEYNVLISAPGFRALETTISIQYCHRTTQTRVL